MLWLLISWSFVIEAPNLEIYDYNGSRRKYFKWLTQFPFFLTKENDVGVICVIFRSEGHLGEPPMAPALTLVISLLQSLPEWWQHAARPRPHDGPSSSHNRIFRRGFLVTSRIPSPVIRAHPLCSALTRCALRDFSEVWILHEKRLFFYHYPSNESLLNAANNLAFEQMYNGQFGYHEML